ncbi:basic leucine zipper transcriptional factor ATF-like 3 isoform X1 [Zalophus californianus]|uniref:Basic leucine zipper transcriptional factor ATF-like 3 isoform X1 n=1 Tax=Zalophus californianus TaxID=9704 RepID=A0A6J2EJD9_ZALCA|nr:basic leucine zipper transcriptional factor ATF-like 3 isoform X1 [Zalophus californianus]
MPRWDRETTPPSPRPSHPLVSLSLKFPESGRRTPKAVLRLLEPLAAPASPLLWGLRVPSRVSEPPRDFHEAQGPRKAAAGSPEDDDRKVRRREKNRVAAQRSRKKQTQKADKLHEEYECLEQENTVLRREIGKLTEELKHLSEALKEHEKMCPLLCPMNFVPLPRPDPVAGCLPR